MVARFGCIGVLRLLLFKVSTGRQTGEARRDQTQVPWFARHTSHSQFLHYRLISSLEIINIGIIVNDHIDLKIRMVLVACVSYIDVFVRWKPADNAKMANEGTTRLVRTENSQHIVEYSSLNFQLPLIFNLAISIFLKKGDFNVQQFCQFYKGPLNMSFEGIQFLQKISSGQAIIQQ